MRNGISARVLVSLAAVLLSACAGTPPATPASPADAQAVATDSGATGASAAAISRRSRIDDYRLVTRGGKELYCKTNVTTGTRVNAKETCYTEAELDKMRDEAQDYLRDVQRPPQEVIDSAGASGA